MSDVPPDLPVGRFVELPGRGATFVREIAGRNDGPTLILLHGWTVTAALNFWPVFRPLATATGLRVLAMDLRGHGRGIKPRAVFRLADCADDVAALAASLGIETIVPIGYSMGGAVAQLVARQHPGITSGAVFCSTAAFFGSDNGRGAMWDVVMPAVATGLTALPAVARQRLLERFLIARVEGDADLAPWMTDELRNNDPAMIAQAGIVIGKFDSRPWLHELAMPTAVVRTLRDNTVSPRRQTVLADGLPNSIVVDVDADHRAAVTSTSVWIPELLRAVASVVDRTEA